MKPMLPVPPGSRVERDIRKMEAVLAALREVVRDSGLASDFYACDASRGGNHVSFDKLFLSDEGPYDWQRFYHYYGVSERCEGPEEADRFCKGAGPDWVRFGTENRIAWGQLLPRLLDALKDKGVHASSDISWRWDHRERPRLNGRPRYVPQYQMLVVSTSPDRAPFDPEPVLEAALRHHCMGRNPLADQHLFDWQEDTVGQRLFNRYGWTRTGVIVTFDTRELLQRAREELFAGLPCVERQVPVKRNSKGTRYWTLEVDLDAAPEHVQAIA